MPVFAASLAFTVLFVLQIDASTVPTATAAPCAITVPQQLLLSPQSWAPHPLVHILVAAVDGATTALVATESVDDIQIKRAAKFRCHRRITARFEKASEGIGVHEGGNTSATAQLLTTAQDRSK